MASACTTCFTGLHALPWIPWRSSWSKGLQHLMALATNQKHPISRLILCQFKSCLDITKPTDAAVWYLFTVAFFSFFRKSNLTALSPTAFDTDCRICHSDIKFTPHGAVFHILYGFHSLPISLTRTCRQQCLLYPPSLPGGFFLLEINLFFLAQTLSVFSY